MLLCFQNSTENLVHRQFNKCVKSKETESTHKHPSDVRGVLESAQVMNNIFFWEDGRVLEQLAQGSCGVSILGDSQNLTGHSHGQPAVEGRALNEDWTRQCLEMPFNPSYIFSI